MDIFGSCKFQYRWPLLGLGISFQGVVSKHILFRFNLFLKFPSFSVEYEFMHVPLCA